MSEVGNCVRATQYQVFGSYEGSASLHGGWYFRLHFLRIIHNLETVVAMYLGLASAYY